MSLPDYYKILQVPVTATSAEIKAAYRRLAKLYHPDKSTSYSDEERFKQIKEAYEHLVDPQRRARYDAKRNRATTFQKAGHPGSQRKPGKKSYSFTEEEAKRRQYYQQHYTKKKQAAASRAQPAETAGRQPSELKYILISVPVAVALLLLIIRMYERPGKKKNHTAVTQTTGNTQSQIGTSESPYKGMFGKMPRDTASAPVIRFVNTTGHDAMVFLRNDSNQTVRHHFIANNYQLFGEELPQGNYHLYYWLGDSFSYRNFLFTTIIGNYQKTVSVDSASSRIVVDPLRKDTFDFVLENKNRQDTALLRKIFFSK